MRVNYRTVTDWLSFADKARLFELALALEAEHGAVICHEMHRGRALYHALDTQRFLTEFPAQRLPAEFSHWPVVHETGDLARQAEAVEAAVGRAWHTHARVGCALAPQVADAWAPEFVPQLQTLLGFWRRILRAPEAEGTDFVAIRPEFEPRLTNRSSLVCGGCSPIRGRSTYGCGICCSGC